VGRAHMRVAGETEVAVALIVTDDDENVGARRW
jgi:hypothetical protein